MSTDITNPQYTSKSTNWGDMNDEDEEEEEEFDNEDRKLPEPQFTYEEDENKNTIKTKVFYLQDGNCLKKCTQKTKIVNRPKSTFSTNSTESINHKEIESRKEWKNFGSFKEGFEFFIEVEPFHLEKEEKKEEKSDPLSKLASKGVLFRCNTCGSTEHFTMKCPKGIRVNNADSNTPFNRPQHGLQNIRDTEEVYSIRVSNLSEDTNEFDLEDLFGRFGSIKKSFLAKKEKDGVMKAKGFAYITYNNKECAEKAIQMVDGHSFGGLVLRVCWSVDRKKY